MILDTSFLLDLKDGETDAWDKAIEMGESDEQQRIALPSVFELYYGVAFTDSEEERRKTQNLIHMYYLASVDESTSKLGAELLAQADVNNGGNSGVDNEDAIIGAVAEKLDEPVVTDNIDDFKRLGVNHEEY